MTENITSVLAKFIAENPGLIPEAELRQHYRRYVRRFWSRIRGKQPYRLPQFLAAMLGIIFKIGENLFNLRTGSS